MPALTTESLREELQRFATDDLQNSLNGLYNRIERTLQNELHGSVAAKRRHQSSLGKQLSFQDAPTYTGFHLLRAESREDTLDSASPLLREQWSSPLDSDEERDIRGSHSTGTGEDLHDSHDSIVRFNTDQGKGKVRSSSSSEHEDVNFQTFDSLASNKSWVNRYRRSVQMISAGSRASASSNGSNAHKKLIIEPPVPFGGGFRKSYATVEAMEAAIEMKPQPRQNSHDLAPDSIQVSGSSNSPKGAAQKHRKTFTDHEISRFSYTRLSTTGPLRQTWRESCQQFVTEIVTDPTFDYTFGVLILMNAAVLGIETDWQARHWPEEKPSCFETINTGLCFIFTLEITMRLYVHGCMYFSMPGWAWNVFDFSMVGLQLLEEAVRFVCFQYFSIHHHWHYQFVVLRVMRIFRIVRVLRLVHVLHIVGELRMLLVSVAGSVRSLFWTVLLLLLLTYVFGLYLTQLVVDYRIHHPEGQEGEEELLRYYGTLSKTMLSLYQTISDGIHWHEVMDPLVTHCSQWIALLFALYIAFALFAFMNVITGVFVESAMRTAEEDKRRLLINQMRSLFEGADLDHSGTISWAEFQSQLDMPELQTYLKAIDLHQEEARELFKLLDCDGSGEIDAVDFVNGCLRLHGSAKAIDFAAFLNEYRWLSLKLMDHVAYAEMCWAEVCPTVKSEGISEELEDELPDDQDGSPRRGGGSFEMMKRAFTMNT